MNMVALLVLGVLSSVSASGDAAAPAADPATPAADATEVIMYIHATVNPGIEAGSAAEDAFKTGVAAAMDMPLVLASHVALAWDAVPVVAAETDAAAPAADAGGHRRLSAVEYDITATITVPENVELSALETAGSTATCGDAPAADAPAADAGGHRRLTACPGGGLQTALDAATAAGTVVVMRVNAEPRHREHDVSGARFGATLGAALVAVVVGASRG